MASAPESPNISVWPSGGAFATALAATTPPAPGTFSTMNGLPKAAVNLSASKRAITSGLPPGPAGATSRTVRVGHVSSCAAACDAKVSAKPSIRAVDVFTAIAPLHQACGHFDAPRLKCCPGATGAHIARVDAKFLTTARRRYPHSSGTMAEGGAKAGLARPQLRAPLRDPVSALSRIAPLTHQAHADRAVVGRREAFVVLVHYLACRCMPTSHALFGPRIVPRIIDGLLQS